MERQIPHVLDVFMSSPGEKRRVHTELLSKDKEEFQKNPGSDSAVSVGSSDTDEDEEQRNISRFFDYLNEDDISNGGSSQRRKKKKTKQSSRDHSSSGSDTERTIKPSEKGTKLLAMSVADKNAKNKQMPLVSSERASRKRENEKDIKHIERHLSMKKTIRKKMMRDLKQAFVEDPKDLQQDPKSLAADKKSNIDISNLTFSKSRLCKSEHNFLDMLKDEPPKEKKGFRALMDFRKDNKANSETTPEADNTKSSPETQVNLNGDKLGIKSPTTDFATARKITPKTQTESEVAVRDDDSGHGSPARNCPAASSEAALRSKSKENLDEPGSVDAVKDNKKQSFWKRITGKSKNKR